MEITQDDLPLECIYRWERERADKPFLTQPFAGGTVRHWTWAQALDESRRMAAYLKAQQWEPGSNVAILAKNCAWWIMADMAIWMAGHVSVPVYPSLRPQSRTGFSIASLAPKHSDGDCELHYGCAVLHGVIRFLHRQGRPG